jgi:uncharacterized RDD family membrane protein YckC
MFCSKCGAAVAEGAVFCTSCGQPASGPPPAAVAATPPPPQPAWQPGPPPGTAPTARLPVTYAGFWLRFVAAFIDGLALGVPLVPIFFLIFADVFPSLIHSQDPAELMMTVLPRVLVLLVIYLVGSWLYWALMESSAWQATLGKKALGLYVTDLAGNRGTFAKTSGRFFAGRGLGSVPYIGGLYFLISCICAGFTEKKQALHDMMAGCLVLRKP